MPGYKIDSIEQVALLEERNANDIESVVLGFQIGVVFLPLEILREVLIPLAEELLYVLAVLADIALSTYMRIVNVLSLFANSLRFGFTGRLGRFDGEPE